MSFASYSILCRSACLNKLYCSADKCLLRYARLRSWFSETAEYYGKNLGIDHQSGNGVMRRSRYTNTSVHCSDPITDEYFVG